MVTLKVDDEVEIIDTGEIVWILEDLGDNLYLISFKDEDNSQEIYAASHLIFKERRSEFWDQE